MKARKFTITARGATPNIIAGRHLAWETQFGFGMDVDTRYIAVRTETVASSFDEIDVAVDALVKTHPTADFMFVTIAIDKAEGSKPRGFSQRYGSNWIVAKAGIDATPAAREAVALGALAVELADA